jgi:hypothetical protein
LPGIKQRVLEGVLGVLEGSEHPVAVHLQLSTMRLGQLSERIAVPGPSPVDQVGCHHSTVASRLSLSVSTSVLIPAERRTGRWVRAHFVGRVGSTSSTALKGGSTRNTKENQR